MEHKLSATDKFDIKLGHIFRARKMPREQSMEYLNEHVPEIMAMKQSVSAKGIRTTPIAMKRDFLQNVLRGVKEF